MAGFNLNSVTISGNLTRDPELKTFNSGAELCEFSVAVNERVKNGEEWEDRASFFDVKLWKGIGRWVSENLRKGDGIAVSGRLNQERWESDGNNRSKVVIVADSIMPRKGEGGGGNGGGYSGGSPAQTDVPAPPPTPAAAPADPDAIPF